ncbi:hypothetical protein C900_03876 [Fulvivirga imtechensis AK7]|uniref:Uncharacterized protein n=1 Tax=Fulvivirga imtechensis AK7 TaxID=1237149 RepID=L8JMN8_9BACT|nr:hypothetical protein [Fulvivirga imtechensis]ELR70191.1 hypothetical protein C900_03876 [Fulvivirga imtechensis AK7]
MNNYLKLLLYLKQFEGDGKMHPIEHLFPGLTLKEKKAIFNELVVERLIAMEGRETKYDSFIMEANLVTGKTKWTESPLNELNQRVKEDEFRAKITFRGSKYLKEELQMQNEDKYSINVSGTSTNNTFVIESRDVTINNRNNASYKLDEIIEILKKDDTINEEERTSIVGDFVQAKQAINQTGKLPERLMKSILEYGSQFSSIGNFIFSLFQS